MPALRASHSSCRTVQMIQMAWTDFSRLSTLGHGREAMQGLHGRASAKCQYAVHASQHLPTFKQEALCAAAQGLA